jgi:Na+/H+-dicarboxylate symporter
MGANVNMDGAAISFPCAVLFLANSESIGDTITVLTWINIALCCSLGSVGAAPVPSAGMVTLITVWQTVFPSHDVPEAIAYVQAIDFLIDRIGTMTNVASDLFIMRILQVYHCIFSYHSLDFDKVQLDKHRQSTVQRDSTVEIGAILPSR